MAISRAKKEKILQDLIEKFSRKKIAIFTDYKGLNVKSLEGLRRKAKSSQLDYKVFKKTLIGLALKNAGVDFNADELRGQIGVAFGYDDEITPSKVVYQFSKENPALKILGGILDTKVISGDEILSLAKLPSREELYARTVATIRFPIYGFVNVLRGNIIGLIYTLNGIKESK